jgi:pimeloyl-ACP methyl ester carboxylesterase
LGFRRFLRHGLLLIRRRFIPGGTHEQADCFNELQLKTTSPECAARFFDVAGDIDITELLPKVKPPTLVMHVRGDRMVPFEAGRQLAASIPGAHFIALPGQTIYSWSMSRRPIDSSMGSAFS